MSSPAVKKRISKSAFAKLAGVSPAAVTKACRSILADAVDGKRIDAAHPDAVAYIASKAQQVKKNGQVKKKSEVKKTPHVRGHSAKNETKKQAALDELAEGRVLHEIPENISAFADMSLRELILRFGTDTAFNDWLKATKMIEDINEKRLKNAETKGELVSRHLVKIGIIDPIDSAHINLLTDGAKTITLRVIAMHNADASADDIETFVRDQIASFIRPVKDRVTRALKNV